MLSDNYVFVYAVVSQLKAGESLPQVQNRLVSTALIPHNQQMHY